MTSKAFVGPALVASLSWACGAPATARTGPRRNLRPVGASDASLEAKYQHPYYWAPFVLIGNWR